MLNASRLIKDLVESNWNANNTSGRTPEFKEYWAKKRVNGYVNNDIVYFYNRNIDESIDHLGNVVRKVVYRVPIDCRTNISDQHCNLIEMEVKRIIRENINYLVPLTCTHSTVGQQTYLDIKTTQPFSNTEDSNYVFNYKRVIELEITSWAEPLNAGVILDDL